ncbi:MAG: hypothetical protein Q7W30_09255, partial [Coriobacteriia bacterium]|nr:hypothetical protein [Coriobacteriia bacterium]
MSDTRPVPEMADYARLGFVANPFPLDDATSDDPYWMRLVTHAASNELIAAVGRAASPERPRPVLVNTAEEIPDSYPRAAQNDFLSRTAHDPGLGMVALNIPLEAMRMGKIRGTLIEVAELAAAVDWPLTAGTYIATVIADVDQGIADEIGVTPEELVEARAAFETDPRAAAERYFGTKSSPTTPAEKEEEGEALHEVYLRQVALDEDPTAEHEVEEEDAAIDPAVETLPETEDEPVEEAVRVPDEEVRDYLLAYVHAHLSAAVSRALAGYRGYGDSMVAQELKVTKAPRKTLGALLKMMSARWSSVVVLYDRFDSWALMEHKMKMDILAALTELRYIVAETGVMGISIVKGAAPELEEYFAAAEQVDWSMPELLPFYDANFAIDSALISRWLDAASVDGVSALKADGPELEPIRLASGEDFRRFAVMAEAAFRDAAQRRLDALDADA